MMRYNMRHDDFLFDLCFISFLLLLLASQYKNEFSNGLKFLVLENGTVLEQQLLQNGSEQKALIDFTSGWTSHAKIIAVLLFSTTGILGSSCASAITKQFGAITMSLTSTARKSITLFLSFALFPNQCTRGHLAGIVLFMISLVMKASSRRRMSAIGAATV